MSPSSSGGGVAGALRGETVPSSSPSPSTTLRLRRRRGLRAGIIASASPASAQDAGAPPSTAATGGPADEMDGGATAGVTVVAAGAGVAPVVASRAVAGEASGGTPVAPGGAVEKGVGRKSASGSPRADSGVALGSGSGVAAGRPRPWRADAVAGDGAGDGRSVPKVAGESEPSGRVPLGAGLQPNEAKAAAPPPVTAPGAEAAVAGEGAGVLGQSSRPDEAAAGPARRKGEDVSPKSERPGESISGGEARHWPCEGCLEGAVATMQRRNTHDILRKSHGVELTSGRMQG